MYECHLSFKFPTVLRNSSGERSHCREHRQTRRQTSMLLLSRVSNGIWRKSHSGMSVLPVSPSSCHHGSPSTTVADESGTYVSSSLGGSNCQVAQRRANHRGETVSRMPFSMRMALHPRQLERVFICFDTCSLKSPVCTTTTPSLPLPVRRATE